MTFKWARSWLDLTVTGDEKPVVFWQVDYVDAGGNAATAVALANAPAC